VISLWNCDVPEIKGVRIDFHPLSSVMNDWQTIVSLRMGGQAFSTVLTPTATRCRLVKQGPRARSRCRTSRSGTAPGGAGWWQAKPINEHGLLPTRRR